MAKTSYEKQKIQGVRASDEVAYEEISRDTRKFGQKLKDGLSEISGIAILLEATAFIFIGLFAFSFVEGFAGIQFTPYLLSFIDYVFLIVIATFLMFRAEAIKQNYLPLRLPASAGPVIDYRDPMPGRSGYNKARGIAFLGYEHETGQHVYASKDELLTHAVVFGTTGAGKTEFLLSWVWNTIATGSGVVYIDPKGTNKLWLQIYQLAKAAGREDDVMIVNFSTGADKVKPYEEVRRSNLSNPFAYGNAESLTEILKGLIPTSEGDNAIFSERAIGLISALMYCLVDLRDANKIYLSVSTIGDYLNFPACYRLGYGDESKEISEKSRISMKKYLISVSGFNEAKGANQGEDVYKQFGFAQAYFTRALASLTDTYGHIFNTLMGEVDYVDVVRNKRILLVVMPALEKAAPELTNLGKVILSAIKSAIATDVGSTFEGSKSNMLDQLATASNTPSLVIIDEFGYVAVEGFAVLPAQARGLGYGFVFAGQDYAGFKRGNEREAESIVANCKLKFIGKLEDAKETWELAKNVAGEADIAKTSSYKIPGDSMTTTYQDQGESRFERTSRITIQDLQQQREGEFHLFFEGTIIRMEGFYASPTLSDSKKAFVEAIINRGLELSTPSPAYISDKYGKSKLASQVLANEIEVRRMKRDQMGEEAYQASMKDHAEKSIKHRPKLQVWLDDAYEVVKKSGSTQPEDGLMMLMLASHYKSDGDKAVQDSTKSSADVELEDFDVNAIDDDPVFADDDIPYLEIDEPLDGVEDDYPAVNETPLTNNDEQAPIKIDEPDDDFDPMAMMLAEFGASEKPSVSQKLLKRAIERTSDEDQAALAENLSKPKESLRIPYPPKNKEVLPEKPTPPATMNLKDRIAKQARKI